MIESRNNNSFGEVSITYNLEDPDNYIVVRGSDSNVNFMSDLDVADLLAVSDALSIVSFHNHPNNSDVSLKDLTVFCTIPQVRLMSIVNARGQVSFFLKTEETDLTRLFVSSISDKIQVLKDRAKESDIIRHELLKKLYDSDVICQDWIDKRDYCNGKFTELKYQK